MCDFSRCSLEPYPSGLYQEEEVSVLRISEAGEAGREETGGKRAGILAVKTLVYCAVDQGTSFSHTA